MHVCVCYVCVYGLCVCMHGVDAQHICMQRGNVCVCACVCYLCVHLLVDTCCLCARCRYTALMCAHVCVCMRVCSVAQSCLTLFDPRDYSPPGSSVHGILQARILEWVVISFSRGSSWPRDRTWVSCIGRWIHYHWFTREAQLQEHACLIFQFSFCRKSWAGLTAILSFCLRSPWTFRKLGQAVRKEVLDFHMRTYVWKTRKMLTVAPWCFSLTIVTDEG